MAFGKGMGWLHLAASLLRRGTRAWSERERGAASCRGEKAVVLLPLHFSRVASAMSMTESAKRQRLLDAGSPIEDGEAARQKMRDAYVLDDGSREFGFDPDDVTDVKEDEFGTPLTPMTYFSGDGDLPMMRWLYVNGADVTFDPRLYRNFPMKMAALRGHEEAVKWLFLHGAASDIVGEPFKHLLREEQVYRNLVVWLILNGAFCRNGNEHGLLEVKKLKTSLGPMNLKIWSRSTFANGRRHLLEWAVERHEARTSFLTFLNGTHPRQEGKISPFLVSLNGKPGILELIADYSGPPLGREARIVRQLAELLPGVCLDFWMLSRSRRVSAAPLPL